MRMLVAIPVYNEERYLARVVQAVKRYTRDILVIELANLAEYPSRHNELWPTLVRRLAQEFAKQYDQRRLEAVHRKRRLPVPLFANLDYQFL